MRELIKSKTITDPGLIGLVADNNLESLFYFFGPEQISPPSKEKKKLEVQEQGSSFFNHGVNGKRNGAGVILKFACIVLEVKKIVSDRVKSLRLETEGVMFSVVGGYAPQVVFELEEKE